jgi:hypothetical protein
LYVFDIRHYLTPNQKDVYVEWRLQLRDTNARIALDRRINRIELAISAITSFAAMACGSCAST